MSKQLFYLGCYTPNNNPGIKVMQLDTESGALSCINELFDLSDASFLSLSDDHKQLLAVSEDEKAGHLALFDLSDKTAPKFINQQPSLGGAPCHISLYQNRAFVSNYASGNVAAFALSDDSLVPAYHQVQHHGQGGNLDRQASAHAHSSIVSKDGTKLIIADLGIDQLKVYQIEAESLQLVQSVKLPAAAGPRHLAFNPAGDKLYLANELNSYIVVFDFVEQSGELIELQTISSLPADFEQINYIAEIYFSDDGKFVYVSNRGHDSITTFKVDAETGLLTALNFTATKGQFPRHFAISPDQLFLIVANQNSDNLFVFHRNPETGLLSDSLQSITATAPVCICFL